MVAPPLAHRSPSSPTESVRCSIWWPRGFDNATISQRLVLSPKTVRNHVANVLAKLSLKDRAAAIVAAREAGLGG